MTLGNLKKLDIGDHAFVMYWDENDKLRINEIMTLTHKDEEEYCFNNNVPIPIYKVKTGDDTELNRIENSGWCYTISNSD